jgi:hypothetical protein
VTSQARQRDVHLELHYSDDRRGMKLMGNLARRIAIYYVALMFMGKKYQERVKNSLNTPDTAAVGLVSLIVSFLALGVLELAGNHGYFFWLMSLPRRAYIYPAFFLIYFINWRIWRVVRRPDNKIGEGSRELAERLPFFAILLFLGIALAIFACLLLS